MNFYVLQSINFDKDWYFRHYDKTKSIFDVYLQENDKIPSKTFSWETGIKFLLCCNPFHYQRIKNQNYTKFIFGLKESFNANTNKIKFINFFFDNVPSQCRVTLTGIPCNQQTMEYTLTDYFGFNTSQGRNFPEKLIQFSMPFAGKPLVDSLHIFKRYIFPEKIEKCLSDIFEYSNKKQQFKNIPSHLVHQLVYSFSYVNSIHKKLENIRLIDPLPFFKNNGGLLYFKDQEKGKDIYELSMAKFLFQKDDNNIVNIKDISKGEITQIRSKQENVPTFMTNPLRIMVYIFPQFASILKEAIKHKKFLNHQYIHMLIDASFKAIRPYVYAVPRIEMYWATVPLGLIMAPTESAEMYLYFKQCLEHAIKLHNEKCQKESDKIIINFKNDIFFVSDTGKANISFYEQIPTTHYGFCTHHTQNINGAFSQLCQLSSDILKSHSSHEWETNRKTYFESLKTLYKMALTSQDSKQAEKINQFARDLGLSNNLLEEGILPFDESNAEMIHKLPIARDHSPETTNGPEGGHAEFNKISLRYTCPHRFIFVASHASDEIDRKNFTGPLLRRIHLFKSFSYKQSIFPCFCSCPMAQYMFGVFGILLCYHTAASFLTQFQYNNIIPVIKFSKDFKWNDNTQYIFYMTINNQNQPWPISKTMYRICVYHNTIKLHNFNTRPDEYYFYNCLKRLFYCSLKLIGENKFSQMINIIQQNISIVLSRYFQPVKIDEEIVIKPIKTDFNDKFQQYYLEMKSSLITLQTGKSQISGFIIQKVGDYIINYFQHKP